MTALAMQSPAHAGAALTMTTPVNGDTAPTGSGVELLVFNPTGGTTITVSLPVISFDGLTVGPRVVTVLAGSAPGTFFVIPLPASVYGGPTVTLTYTGTLTNVLVACVNTPGN